MSHDTRGEIIFLRLSYSDVWLLDKVFPTAWFTTGRVARGIRP